jgi:two-component system OmpR family response regulator
MAACRGVSARETAPVPEAVRVLVVDDEPSITDAVATALGYEGFEVATAPSGRAALERIRLWAPDLVVLDVMLPDVDGVALTRHLREAGDGTPILFLTARDEPDDRVAGLVAGGDDYVTKPFTLAELIARVHAILRRTRPPVTGRLGFADVEMDLDTHEVWRAGTPVRLTATEFNLLRYFLERPRVVLSKARILDEVWDEPFDGDPNLVETYVSYLRKKLDPLGPPLIHTVRSVGYALRDPEG